MLTRLNLTARARHPPVPPLRLISDFLPFSSTFDFLRPVRKSPAMLASLSSFLRTQPPPPRLTTITSLNSLPVTALCLKLKTPNFRRLSLGDFKGFTSPLRCRLIPARAAEPDSAPPIDDQGPVKAINDSLEQWDSLTAKFSGAANLPFLLLQLPQIILNARNLLAGNKAALLAVPWLGMLTGLLGNLSLLSYFAKKKEAEAVVVQTLGVISTYIVLSQLAMADAMPLSYFVVISAVIMSGLVLNFMNYFGFLNASIWGLWEDFITIGGLSVLPQVMWSTFIPYVPNSILPGAICLVAAVATVVMARLGKLSKAGMKFYGGISGWTATLLFMWMPVSQMLTNFLNPSNIKGLSALSMLLAMTGNGLMLPRALFIRDLMWFTGSVWATLFYGWGNLLCMYICNTISQTFFLAATTGLVAWIGLLLWRDSTAHGYTSPFRPLKELVSGPR